MKSQVFPASQLGNENQINEGLGLGTVDIIYTGTSFAGSIHKPLAISGAPFMLRDFNHWKAYRDSKLFRDIAKGYEDKTKHKIIALTYYGERMVTANKEIKKPEDMKGMKLRVPPAPLYLMLAKSVGANATPIAFAEVYLALQQGTVDGQENPLPTIMAKKFYEVQSHIMLTGHIIESLLTITGSHVWSKLSDADKKVFDEVLVQAAAKSSDQIRESEQKIADELRKLGKTVVQVDREAFRKAAIPLHNDASAGAGWSQAEYDDAAGAEVSSQQRCRPGERAGTHTPWRFIAAKLATTFLSAKPPVVMGPCFRRRRRCRCGSHSMNTDPKPANAPTDDVHLIVATGRRGHHRASSGELDRVRAVLGAGYHRLPAVLHPIRPQRQPLPGPRRSPATA